MRILHLIPFLWSGAGDVVTRLAMTQSTRDDVAMVTSGASRGLHDWPRYRRRLAAAGVPLHRIDFFDRSPEVYWRSLDALTRLVEQWQPHVLHAHAGVPTSAAVLASRSARRGRVVAQFYNWGPGRPPWMDDMDIAGFRSADVVICSARHYQAMLTARGVPAARLQLIPWGLDDCWFAPRSTAARPRRPRVVGFVGRIEPRKGQLDLVRAFARLARSVPDVRLELVGPVADAAYASSVAACIAREGIGPRVSLRGQVRDVGAHLRTWSAFVSLSRDEGQGMAVLEAMASEVPVVARLVPGVEDVLFDGETGYVIATGSPGSAAAAMRRCLGDDRRSAIVRAARQLARRRFQWSQTTRQMQLAYRAARAADGWA